MSRLNGLQTEAANFLSLKRKNQAHGSLNIKQLANRLVCAKKTACEGGLSLGRKRPKRRMQHRCCTAQITSEPL